MEKRNILIIILLDILLVNLSYYLSIYFIDGLRFSLYFFKTYTFHIILITFIKITIFYISRKYNNLWKYVSFDYMVKLIITLILSNTLIYLLSLTKYITIPLNIIVLTGVFDIFLIGGIRFGYRFLYNIINESYKFFKFKKYSRHNNTKRVLIIGAGEAGAMVIKELKRHKQLNYKPIAIIDDNIKKEGIRINGVPVVGQRHNIRSIVRKKNIDIIIIAIPSASKKEIKKIIKECKKTFCKLKILPGMYEIIGGKVSINEIRDVEIKDLLGREAVELNIEEISHYLTDKKVLVTGGGGSIGSELCRQIIRFNPKELIILDIYENNAYDLLNELNRKMNKNPSTIFEKLNQNLVNVNVVIASVRDKQRVFEVIKNIKPDVVFHAAAHKHVPLMESNPAEAIKNNVFGTFNIVQACEKYGVKKFVLISTDKAVNPTNVMGVSKRICEMIVQSINTFSKTKLVAVRFGNVLGSNGSVIPLFKNQIKDGGPITVTDPEIIRYFMTIPEATQLVIQAGALAKGGEIFVLDMGEPVKILNLAEDLIRLSGFEPYKDIDIKFTGLRDGEKLFEELLLEGEGIKSTSHKKIFIGKPTFGSYDILLKHLNKLREIINKNNSKELIEYLKIIVPTYEHKNKN